MADGRGLESRIIKTNSASPTWSDDAHEPADEERRALCEYHLSIMGEQEGVGHNSEELIDAKLLSKDEIKNLKKSWAEKFDAHGYPVNFFASALACMPRRIDLANLLQQCASKKENFERARVDNRFERFPALDLQLIVLSNDAEWLEQWMFIHELKLPEALLVNEIMHLVGICGHRHLWEHLQKKIANPSLKGRIWPGIGNWLQAAAYAKDEAFLQFAYNSFVIEEDDPVRQAVLMNVAQIGDLPCLKLAISKIPLHAFSLDLLHEIANIMASHGNIECLKFLAERFPRAFENIATFTENDSDPLFVLARKRDVVNLRIMINLIPGRKEALLRPRIPDQMTLTDYLVVADDVSFLQFEGLDAGALCAQDIEKLLILAMENDSLLCFKELLKLIEQPSQRSKLALLLTKRGHLSLRCLEHVLIAYPILVVEQDFVAGKKPYYSKSDYEKVLMLAVDNWVVRIMRFEPGSEVLVQALEIVAKEELPVGGKQYQACVEFLRETFDRALKLAPLTPEKSLILNALRKKNAWYWKDLYNRNSAWQAFNETVCEYKRNAETGAVNVIDKLANYFLRFYQEYQIVDALYYIGKIYMRKQGVANIGIALSFFYFAALHGCCDAQQVVMSLPLVEVSDSAIQFIFFYYRALLLRDISQLTKLAESNLDSFTELSQKTLLARQFVDELELQIRLLSILFEAHKKINGFVPQKLRELNANLMSKAFESKKNIATIFGNGASMTLFTPTNAKPVNSGTSLTFSRLTLSSEGEN